MRPILFLFAPLIFLSNGAAQSLSCFTSGGTNTPISYPIALTGATSDFQITCSGGIPTTSGGAIPTVDIHYSLTTPITSRSLSTSGGNWTEALLLLDEPGVASQFACETVSGVCSALGNGIGAPTYYGPGVPGTAGNNKNVFQGRLIGPNELLFAGIPIDPPGTSGFRL